MLQGMAHGRGGSAAFVEGKWVDEPVAEKIWEAPLPPPIGPQSCVSVPWGDVATAPRSTGAPNVRVFFAVPQMVAKALPLTRSLLPILGTTPVQKLLEAAIERIPEGASDEERARAYSAVLAQAQFREGRSASAWLSLGEGYTLTAIMAALCASLCARPDFTARGALTPTQAFGAKTLLDGLVAAGAKWGVTTATSAGEPEPATSRR
jgi:short subunit dehydrogenase-like uncharacterized protein